MVLAQHPMSPNPDPRLQNEKAGQCCPAFRFQASIETLRPALQRERGSFSNYHGGTPIRPLTVVGSEVGRELKGLDRRLKELW